MNRHFKCLINGEWIEGNGAPFEVKNPATFEIVATCANADTSQLELAVEAAEVAFKSWSTTSHQMRKEALNAIAEEIESRASDIAKLIVEEQGKPFELAMGEVHGGLAWLRYAASQDIPVEIAEDTETKRIEIHRKPLGVVASITPWNWPFMIAIWHIIPALRAGNTVINKPSSLTPLSTITLIEIMNKHLPKGSSTSLPDKRALVVV